MNCVSGSFYWSLKTLTFAVNQLSPSEKLRMDVWNSVSVGRGRWPLADWSDAPSHRLLPSTENMIIFFV